MDEAVGEIFQSMLERSCRPLVQRASISPDVTACISFSGALEARCVVEFASPAAQQLASAFLSSELGAWDTAMVGDAVGELCNMIAGGWKQRIGAEANLSVPTICWAPTDCPRQSCAPCMRRVYEFDDSAFVVILTT